MERTIGFLGALATVALLSGGGALAQGRGDMERLDRIFERIDLDASGTITVPEMRAAAAARFDALDRDGDGTVHGAERDADRNARLETIFRSADRDGNGRLDAVEVVEVAKQRARRRLVRLDTDGDGMLSLEELQRVRPGRDSVPSFEGRSLTLERLDARMMAMFRRADANGDGIVTLREATAGATR